MTADPRTTTRRSLLATSGSLSILALAGCLGDDDDEEGEGSDDHGDDHSHDDDHADDHGDDDDHDDDHDDHDDDHDDHDHDDEVSEFEIIDRDTDEVTAYVHGDHWHDDLPEVPVGDNISLGAVVTDADGEEIPLGDDEEYTLNVEVAEGAQEIVETESHGDHVHITGKEEGMTEVVFQLWHDDHSDYDTPPIPVEVVEE